MLPRYFIQKTCIGFTAALISVTALAVAEVDQPAPAFSGVAADGSTINLNAYKGKTVVLEWTNNECPFVQKHYEKRSCSNIVYDLRNAHNDEIVPLSHSSD